MISYRSNGLGIGYQYIYRSCHCMCGTGSTGSRGQDTDEFFPIFSGNIYFPAAYDPGIIT